MIDDRVKEELVDIQYDLLPKGFSLEEHLETVKEISRGKRLKHYKKLLQEGWITKGQYHYFVCKRYMDEWDSLIKTEREVLNEIVKINNLKSKEFYQDGEVEIKKGHVKVLHLQKKGIKKLPSNIYRLEEINSLILDYNDLTTLPPGIEKILQRNLEIRPHSINRIKEPITIYAVGNPFNKETKEFLKNLSGRYIWIYW